MADEAYISEIKIFAFNFAPRSWAQCNGQLLPINQNQALFSLLGTTYGGDGRVNFALPDLRGRVPIHLGNGFTQGQMSGEENHTLTLQELPAHNHGAVASASAPDVNTPQNNFWASNTGFTPYASTPNETMSGAALSSVGGSQPHNNLSPYLALNICIALVGVFPSRD
jgi:microcystin-dependent protein